MLNIGDLFYFWCCSPLEGASNFKETHRSTGKGFTDLISKLDAKNGKLLDPDKFQAVLSNLQKKHLNSFCEYFDILPN